VDSLIGQFRAHLHGRSLPAPAYVELDITDQKATVHPRSGWDLATVLGSLLAWAGSLTDVTATWHRSSHDWLHLTIHGDTGSRLSLTVSECLPFGSCADRVQLDLGESRPVSLQELRALHRQTCTGPEGVA
jgi:hypothetical protein